MDNELILTKEEWHELDGWKDQEGGWDYFLVFHGGGGQIIDKDPELVAARQAFKDANDKIDAVANRYREAYGEFWEAE